MKLKYLNIALFPSLFLLLFNINLNPDYYSNLKNEDTLSSVSISFVGDLMCHSPQFNYAKVNEDSFNFNPVYRYIKSNLSKADYTFGNFETVLGGSDKKYSGYPFFNTPDDYLSAIKEAGFDFLFTSNNHSLDQREPGLLRTLKVIRSNKLNSSGTFSSNSDRDSIRILFINGISIAILSYSYGTNGQPVPAGKEYLINLIKEDLIIKDLQNAKNLKTDLVLVYFHFGEEYKKLPNDFQKGIVSLAIENGADLIIGSHPHVIQPFEMFKSKNINLDSGFVAYSLGNFISNQRDRYTDAGVILNLNIEKNKKTNKLKISSVEYTPTWVFKGNTKNGPEYIILPYSNSNKLKYEFLTTDMYKQMQQAFEDTKSIITYYSDKFVLKGD